MMMAQLLLIHPELQSIIFKIYQGLADSTVPKLATDLLISNATTVGTKINSYVTGNWDHGTAMSSNVDNIVADVKTLMPPQ